MGGLKNNKINFIAQLLLAAICIMMLIPFFSAARFAVFSGDDFAFYNSIQEQTGKNYFIRCLQAAIDTYMSWQGTYLDITMIPFNPLIVYSYAMLRLELMGLIGLSVAALLWLSYEINTFFKLNKKTVFIFALIFLPLCLYRDYSEVYLWYIGAMSYLFTIAIMLIGFASLLKFKNCGKKFWAYLSGAFFFMLGGAPLTIGGIAAWFLLLAFIVSWVEGKKPDLTMLYLFLCIFVGDLINVAAPGNYARNSALGGLNIFGALHSSVSVALEEILFLSLSNGFFVFIVLAYLLGIQSKKQISAKFLIPVILALVITPVICLFPFMLGYNSSDASLELISWQNRTLFCLDIAIVLSFELSAFLAGSITGSRLLCKLSSRFRLGLAVVFCAVACISFASGIESFIPIQITQNLINGKIETHSVMWHEIYDMLRDTPGDDIVLVEMPEPCVGTLEVAWAAYPTHPVNMDWAQYFGNKSVCTAYYISSMQNNEG